MNDTLRASMVGFDITPRFHPTCGAWGSTSSITKVDIPLMARCLALSSGDFRVLWFGSDLIGEVVADTDGLRAEVADALDLHRDQVIWSTSQTHSSGALPGSTQTGSGVCDVSKQDEPFMEAERTRFMKAYIEAGQVALAELQPVTVWAGRGFCDSMSYNTRLPMPTGGVKFSRHHAEGLQSGKTFDTTIGLLRFERPDGRTIGTIFNFCAHPATMIDGPWISPDWVGTARQHLEEALDNAPAMFCQGMCGDVNCYHIFGTPELAARNGTRLGRAMVMALPTLLPVRSDRLGLLYETLDIRCQPMPHREEMQEAIAAREAFIRELSSDPHATWCCGLNLPEQFTVEQKIAASNMLIAYFQEGIRMIESTIRPRESLPLTIGALRIGDVAAILSPGENFTATGMDIRRRSPFEHTLICGDTNGMFGYIGDDKEIDRGGFETESFWRYLADDGFRLPPAKGTVVKIVTAAERLLWQLHRHTRKE